MATFPLFYEKADSPAMVNHAITLLMKTGNFLNPGQVLVLHVISLSSLKLNIYSGNIITNLKISLSCLMGSILRKHHGHALEICWYYPDGAHCWYKPGLQNPVQQIHI